jgi:Tfp pilus assembly protein PilO
MKLTPQRWLILGAVATVIVMIVIYTSIISPARSREAAKSALLSSEQTAIAGDRAQLAQLQALAANEPAELAKAFRLAQAVPVGPQTPGMILELQALAKASDVTLTEVRTISSTPVNDLTATLYEIDVVGRFFNVDDFVYRVHHQVNVSSSGAVAIKGRLFAVTSVQLSLAGSAGGSASSSPNTVQATLQVMTFSSAQSGGASGSSGASGGSGRAGASGGATGATGTGTTTSPGTTTTPSTSGSPR